MTNDAKDIATRRARKVNEITVNLTMRQARAVTRLLAWVAESDPFTRSGLAREYAQAQARIEEAGGFTTRAAARK